MLVMTTTGGSVSGQLDLFGDAVPDVVPEPVLMALHAEYYGTANIGLSQRMVTGKPATAGAAGWAAG